MSRGLQDLGDRRRRERRAAALEDWHNLKRTALRRRDDRLRILDVRITDFQARYHSARRGIPDASRLTV